MSEIPEPQAPSVRRYHTRGPKRLSTGMLGLIAVIAILSGRPIFLGESFATEVHGSLPPPATIPYDRHRDKADSPVIPPYNVEESPVLDQRRIRSSPRTGPKRLAILKWVEEHGTIYNIAMSAVLVVCAGFASGMTVGLLSIDPIQLKVLMEEGTESEKDQAKKLDHVLSNHHLLLVTLLLANAIAMEALPLFLNKTVPEWAAVVLSVTAILAFGEVLPQALCTGKWQIPIVMKSLPIVRGLLCSLFIISWPIAKLLDAVLGHNEQTFYARSHLKALIRLHQKENRADHERSQHTSTGGEVDSALGADEVVVIEGALDLATKHVVEIMVPWDKVYMLEWNTALTHELKTEILNAGHSRIPVYRKHRHNVVGLLLVKSLIIPPPLPDGATSLVVGDCVKRTSASSSGGSPKPSPIFCEPTLQLYDLLNEFQRGRHLAFITKSPMLHKDAWERNVDLPEEIDDDKRLIGIATLEDVIEELIQEEIYDEFDHYASVAFPPVTSATAKALPSAESTTIGLSPRAAMRMLAHPVVVNSHVNMPPSNRGYEMNTGTLDREGIVARAGSDGLCPAAHFRETGPPPKEPVLGSGTEGKVILAARTTRKAKDAYKTHPGGFGPKRVSASIPAGQPCDVSRGRSAAAYDVLKYPNLGRRFVDICRPLIDDQQIPYAASIGIGTPAPKLPTSADTFTQSRQQQPTFIEALESQPLQHCPPAESSVKPARSVRRQPVTDVSSMTPLQQSFTLAKSDAIVFPPQAPRPSAAHDPKTFTASTAGGEAAIVSSRPLAKGTVPMQTATQEASQALQSDATTAVAAGFNRDGTNLPSVVDLRQASSMYPALLPSIVPGAPAQGTVRGAWQYYSTNEPAGFVSVVSPRNTEDSNLYAVATRVHAERLANRVKTVVGIAARKQLQQTAASGVPTTGRTTAHTTPQPIESAAAEETASIIAEPREIASADPPAFREDDWMTQAGFQRTSSA